MTTSEHYLDQSATTRPSETALRALNEAPWGNPSSVHRIGLEAAAALKEAIAKAETFENAISSDSLPYVFSRITLAKDASGQTVLPYAFNWKGKKVSGTLIFYYDKGRDKVTSLVFAKEYKK